MIGTARSVAVAVLIRIDTEGAFAHLALPRTLDRSGLSARDRALVTELVNGATRRRRALDWVVDRFLSRPPPPPARAVLRLGAYQLLEMNMAAHAAVSTTVDAAPERYRGLANAVLRRVAEVAPAYRDGSLPWPNDATRLSYPDWIVKVLAADLGRDDALKALEAMNRPPPPPARGNGDSGAPAGPDAASGGGDSSVPAGPDAASGGGDSGAPVNSDAAGGNGGSGAPTGPGAPGGGGYRPDLASRLVADAVAVSPGDLVYDMCASPGGKALALAGRGATVMAGELHRNRARLLARNRDEAGAESMGVLAADGRNPPFGSGRFDAVLVDAPCSGLGTLRRRSDARWRVEPDSVARLAGLQRDLIDAAAGLLRPGGSLAYSVCTLTAAETLEVADHAAGQGDLEPDEAPPEPWRPHGTGGILLPEPGHDGMALFRWRKV